MQVELHARQKLNMMFHCNGAFLHPEWGEIGCERGRVFQASSQNPKLERKKHQGL
jgi:hypothetical protein